MKEPLPAQATTSVTAPTVNLRDLALEVCLRIASAFLFATFAFAAYKHWLADPARITLLCIVAAESLTVCLSLIARVPAHRDWHPAAILCSLGATYYFIGIRLAPGFHVIPEVAGAALQIAGIAWQIYAKLSLRLSFGLLPANRGIVTNGAYRFVRHPMYLGYLITHIGFLLVNFGLQNVLIFVGLYILQGVRIMREERLLSADPSYRAYRSRVQFRILPGVY